MGKRLRQTRLPGMEDPTPEVEPAVENSPVISSPKTTEAPSTEIKPVEILPEAGPVSLKGKVLYVVDSHSLIFQVFHGIGEMTSPQGEPVNAIFGFMRDILYIIRERKPDFLICAFDRGEPTFRHEMYEQYKGQRADMPDTLLPQIKQIREMMPALGVPVVDYPRYEADDILATLAKHAEAEGGKCFLVTSDKDCRQLITERVKLYNVRKNFVYDEAALLADWGIRPDQVVDFQTMVGDPVDNIPGIPLIGPKIAGQLLSQYGTLEGVLEHVEEISGKKRKENILASREIVLKGRPLVKLADDVPLTLDWQAARLGEVDVDKCLELCQRYGFRRIAEEIAGLKHLAKAKPVAPPPKWEHDYRLVGTSEEFETFLANLQQQPQVSFDTETTSVHPRLAQVVGYSFSWQPGVAYYLPVMAPPGEPCLPAAETLRQLKPVLENPKIKKIGQNLKYDMIVLRSAGVQVQGIEFDSMVASYLLGAGQRTHNLDDLALRYFQHKTTKISELIGTGKQQKRMDEVPVRQITHYAAEDADVPVRLEPIMRQELAQAELQKLFADVEMPLVEVLTEMEYLGIKVNTARLSALSEQYGQLMTTVEAEIYALAGHQFNINSPKQLQKILFDELQLPVVKRGASGPSTDVDVLQELAAKHPLPAKIVEYRQYAKLKGTYLDALPQLIHPETGRVHASFNQVVAATGRLSSSDPNLQNIPIRTEQGREIRAAFQAGQPGWQLLCADYSQIELRILAHFCGDEVLCQAFADNQDIHALVAAQVNNVSLEEVTKDMRRQAKAVNFGVIYGQSAGGLARQLNISREEAQTFIDAYFARYPGVGEFLSKILAEARESGYVKTILGRRRMIEGVRESPPPQRNPAERMAINTVIQGSAADLIKLAMIAIHSRLRDEGLLSRMLLQIHDELVFEAPSPEIPRLAQLVVKSMTSVLPLSVPLKVYVSTGPNWLETETLTVPSTSP